VDHEKTPVSEFDTDDLQRHPIRIVSEKDNSRVGIASFMKRCVLVEDKAAMFNNVARACTRYPVSCP